MVLGSCEAFRAGLAQADSEFRPGAVPANIAPAIQQQPLPGKPTIAHAGLSHRRAFGAHRFICPAGAAGPAQHLLRQQCDARSSPREPRDLSQPGRRGRLQRYRRGGPGSGDGEREGHAAGAAHRAACGHGPDSLATGLTSAASITMMGKQQFVTKIVKAGALPPTPTRPTRWPARAMPA